MQALQVVEKNASTTFFPLSELNVSSFWSEVGRLKSGARQPTLVQGKASINVGKAGGTDEGTAGGNGPVARLLSCGLPALVAVALS
jgi:hypothetical protein